MKNLKFNYTILILGASLALPFSLQAGPACCGGGAEAHGNPAVQPVSAGVEHDHRTAWVKTYEGISEALVQDDLATTREQAALLAKKVKDDSGAEAIGRHAEAVAEAETLEAARSAFQPLSRAVIKQVEEQDGFYVLNCPMVPDGNWLQSERQVRNPYMGQRMVRCGGVVRATGTTNPAR